MKRLGEDSGEDPQAKQARLEDGTEVIIESSEM